MRIALHLLPERSVLTAAQRQRLRLVDHVRKPGRGIERRTPVYAWDAVCYPELKQVRRAELNRAVSVRDADEVSRKQNGRRLIETPVRHRDAGIDRLQFPLEIEQIGAVPWQESLLAVGLRRAGVGVHIAEVGETSRPLVIELAKGGDEARDLGRGQRVGIFSYPHHQPHLADQERPGADFDSHVSVGLARMSETAQDKEWHRNAGDRQLQRDGRGRGARRRFPERDRPSPATETLVRVTLTNEPITPEELVSRMRQGAGSQVT